MKVTLPGLAKGFIPTILVGLLIVAVLRYLGYIGSGAAEDEPTRLIREATENLEAVSRRKPSDRRPASYDSVMTPLDGLLLLTKNLLESDTYNPVTDFDRLQSLAEPIIDIATRADRQARSETGFLTKEYRFNDQKGEAIQYLANAMWERINHTLRRSSGYFHENDPYPPHAMDALRRLVDSGLEASPDNSVLWYIRGVVNRADGLFAPAARDLERAVELNQQYVAAWNTLGLVRISLREFTKAEEALEYARDTSLEQARRFGREPGAEYIAVIFNLAMFHEGLATFYSRENRLTPTVESQRLLTRHAAEARKYLEEFLAREPADTDDAKMAQAKLQSLPQ